MKLVFRTVPLAVAVLLCSQALFAADGQADSVESLLQEIIPDNGAVRPPYQLARYDMGLEPKEKLDELSATALERQDRLEARWVELRKNGATGSPAQRSLLAYAFGEGSLKDAQKATREFGERWRFRLARLLLAECRFDAAIEELMALADGKGEKASAALVQLVALQKQADALSESVELVPFKVDLGAYLEERAQNPSIAQLIKGLQRGIPCPMPSDSNVKEETLEPEGIEIVEEPHRNRLIENPLVYYRTRRVHTATDLLCRQYAIQSLNKKYLEYVCIHLVLYREGSGSDIVTGSQTELKLHTDCGGPIKFKLYRFENRKAWEELEPDTLAGLNPTRRWQKEFRPLRKNNRGKPEAFGISVKDLTEGYYLVTAEARYVPVVAAQKFAVSHVALYLRTNPNQAIVAAVDRRTGVPVPQVPIRLTGRGRPVMRAVDPDHRTRSDAFRAGFNQTTVPDAADLAIKPADFEKVIGSYQEGLKLRSRFPEVKFEKTQTTGVDGMAAFPLDLTQGYRFDLQAVRQTVGFAEAHLSANIPAEPADQVKALVWAAQPLYRPGDQVHFKGVVRRFNQLRVAPHDAEWKKQVKVQIKNDKEPLWEGTCALTKAGCFSGDFKVPPAAALGYYDVLVDGTEARPSGALKVEQFRVPTFRVEIEMASSTAQSGRSAMGCATVKYAFGKPVANAEVEVALECGSEQHPSLTCYTDAMGRAKFDLPLPAVPEAVRSMVRATVLDAAGESYSGFDYMRITPVPFRLYAPNLDSLELIEGQTAQIKVLASDWQDKPLPNVTIALFGSKDAVVTDKEGVAQVTFTAPKSARRETLHFTAVRGKEAVHLTRRIWIRKAAEKVAETDKPQPARVNDVRISIEQYPNAGEPLRAKLTVQRRTDGKAFVVLFAENTRLLAHRSLQLEPGTHEIQFDTDLDFAPSCKLEAVLLTGHNTKTDSRIVRVKPVQRFLTLNVTTDQEEYRPGATCRAEVFAYDWQKRPVANAEISLGIVNESLYGLRSDPTPDLQDYFYHYYLPHWSWWKYDARLPYCAAAVWLKGPKLAWGYWDSGVPAFGLDEGGGGQFGHRSGGGRRRAVSPPLRINFRNEAHWVANLVTDSQGRARVQFAFPDNITYWRFTARGVTADTLVGEVRCKHRTFLPTQIELSLPRALRAGDRIAAAALVHNNKKAARDFALQFGADAGTGKTVLSATAEGTARTEFPLAPVQPNPLTLKASVRVDGGEEGDAIQRELAVLPGGYPVSRTRHGQLKDSASIPLSFDLSTQPEHLELTLSLEPGVVGPVISAVDRLIQYPYGCVEQTMSRFMPALIAGRAMKRAQLSFAKEKELPAILQKGVARLSGFQHRDGGWGWWKTDSSNDFMTAYVLEGLTLCREAGHAVPGGMLQNAATYLFERLNTEKLAEDRTVYSIGEVSPGIYVTHALALYYASEPERYATQMERLKTLLPEVEKKLALSRDRVLRADTYRLLGLEKQAQDMLGKLRQSVRPVAGNRSSILATATFLETSAAVQPDRAASLELARQLIALRRGDQWCDTQTTAAIVRGLSTLITGEVEQGAPVDVLVDGNVVARMEPKIDSATRLKLKRELVNARTVTLRPMGKVSGDCFWSARLSGYADGPLPVPNETVASVSCRVFRVRPKEREITTDKEGTLEVKRGETLRIRLKCETKKPLSYLRVSLPRPCGVEMIRPPKPVSGKKSNGFVSFEQHDDGFHFFLDHCEKESEIEFLVRAEVSGTVFSPPPQLEPMYGDPIAVKAIGPRIWQIAAKLER